MKLAKNRRAIKRRVTPAAQNWAYMPPEFGRGVGGNSATFCLWRFIDRRTNPVGQKKPKYDQRHQTDNFDYTLRHGSPVRETYTQL